MTKLFMLAPGLKCSKYSDPLYMSVIQNPPPVICWYIKMLIKQKLMFRHKPRHLSLFVFHQSTQTTLGQMISWVLWLWASAGRNWMTPKTWKTSTSTASSSEQARYAHICSFCVRFLGFPIDESAKSQFVKFNSLPTWILLSSLFVSLSVTPFTLSVLFVSSSHPPSPPFSSLTVENSTCPVSAQKSQTKHWLLWPKCLASCQREQTQPLFHFDRCKTRNVLNGGLVIMES